MTILLMHLQKKSKICRKSGYCYLTNYCTKNDSPLQSISYSYGQFNVITGRNVKLSGAGVLFKSSYLSRLTACNY